MKRFIIILFISFLTGKTLQAQSTFSGWFTIFSSVKVSNKFSIHFDGQVRSSDELEHVQSLLLRAGLNMQVRKNMTVSTGYTYTTNRRVINEVSGYAPEHRIWEQFTVSHPFLNTSLAHRFRLEQRFISKSKVEDDHMVNSGNVFSNRLRYFLRTMLPFTGKLQERTPFVALQNEIFVNLGDKSGVNGEFFDQNRAYIAIGYRFTKHFDLELGYLNQYVNRGNKAFIDNNVLQLATYFRL